MTYEDWSDAIARHFFNPSMRDHQVLLAVTPEVLREIAEESGFCSDLDEAVNGFIREIIKRMRNRSIFEKLALWQWENANNTSYPKFIGLLAALVLAANWEEQDQDFDPLQYYERLFTLLKLAKPDYSPHPRDDTFKQNSIMAWKRLAEWSAKDLNGNYGVFQVPNVSQNQKYVGIPKVQAVLRPRDKDELFRVMQGTGLDRTKYIKEENFVKEIVSRLESNNLSILLKRVLASDTDLRNCAIVALYHEYLWKLKHPSYRLVGEHTSERSISTEYNLRIGIRYDYDNGCYTLFLGVECSDCTEMMIRLESGNIKGNLWHRGGDLPNLYCFGDIAMCNLDLSKTEEISLYVNGVCKKAIFQGAEVRILPDQCSDGDGWVYSSSDCMEKIASNMLEDFSYIVLVGGNSGLRQDLDALFYPKIMISNLQDGWCAFSITPPCPPLEFLFPKRARKVLYTEKGIRTAKGNTNSYFNFAPPKIKMAPGYETVEYVAPDKTQETLSVKDGYVEAQLSRVGNHEFSLAIGLEQTLKLEIESNPAFQSDIWTDFQDITEYLPYLPSVNQVCSELIGGRTFCAVSREYDINYPPTCIRLICDECFFAQLEILMGNSKLQRKGNVFYLPQSLPVGLHQFTVSWLELSIENGSFQLVKVPVVKGYTFTQMTRLYDDDDVWIIGDGWGGRLEFEGEGLQVFADGEELKIQKQNFKLPILFQKECEFVLSFLFKGRSLPQHYNIRLLPAPKFEIVVTFDHKCNEGVPAGSGFEAITECKLPEGELNLYLGGNLFPFLRSGEDLWTVRGKVPKQKGVFDWQLVWGQTSMPESKPTMFNVIELPEIGIKAIQPYGHEGEVDVFLEFKPVRFEIETRVSGAFEIFRDDIGVEIDEIGRIDLGNFSEDSGLHLLSIKWKGFPVVLRSFKCIAGSQIPFEFDSPDFSLGGRSGYLVDGKRDHITVKVVDVIQVSHLQINKTTTMKVNEDGSVNIPFETLLDGENFIEAHSSEGKFGSKGSFMVWKKKVTAFGVRANEVSVWPLSYTVEWSPVWILWKQSKDLRWIAPAFAGHAPKFEGFKGEKKKDLKAWREIEGKHTHLVDVSKEWELLFRQFQEALK